MKTKLRQALSNHKLLNSEANDVMISFIESLGKYDLKDIKIIRRY